MSEKCDVCQRPYCRTLLGDSRDFEQRAKCWKIGYERLQDQFAAGADIAAAEERGRRRGDAERDAALRAARNWIDAHKCCTEVRGALVKLIDAALAPRDSAPAIPSVASQGCPECSKPQPGDLGMGSIEARQLRCPHGKYKPRDSGKEG